MNDRAVALLEQYDLQMNRACKGRECMICDTNQGIRLITEYKGQIDKLPLIEQMQEKVQQIVRTDQLVKNKEGGLYVKDYDGTVYVVKEYVDGHECNYKSEEEVMLAFETMARLHCVMEQAEEEVFCGLPVHDYREDMRRHTREIRHIYNYIHRKSRKTEFERALLQEYDYFLRQAQKITEQVQGIVGNESLMICHGDYQYHNIVYGREGIGILHFEKLSKESGVRDLYYMFRKISEKNNWSIQLGKKMLAAYEKHRILSAQEREELYARLSYPEKFWKIANFYYNSRKTWIPDKNMEKLRQLFRQEIEKQKLINDIFCVKNQFT